MLSHFLSLFLTFSLSLRSTDTLYSHFFSCFLTFHDHTSTARYSRVPRGTHAGGTRARHARGTRARHFVDSRAVLARVMRGTRLERYSIENGTESQYRLKKSTENCNGHFCVPTLLDLFLRLDQPVPPIASYVLQPLALNEFTGGWMELRDK